MWWFWIVFASISNTYSVFNSPANRTYSTSMMLNAAEYSYEYPSDEEIGPDVLVDPVPLEEVLAGPQRKPVTPPKRGFTSEEEEELLRLHNFYRSLVDPPAGNMLFMEWDTELAQTAQVWASKCKFKHGFPPNSYPGPMGQNLYRGPDGDGVRAMALWYEEYVDYDFKTGECVPKKQCGHYTQLAWAKSKFVGCGVQKCGPVYHLIVCHYGPAGNIMGVAPYSVGKPCSLCNTVDGGLCTNNLCVTHRQCEKKYPFCDEVKCSLQCQNCGVLETESCRCKCTPGWDSLDCSVQCRDENERCGKRPGWPDQSTCTMNQFAVQDRFCRKMCSQCRDVSDGRHLLLDDNKAPNLKRYEPRMLLRNGTCCAGVLCPYGYVLDLERRLCRCQILCPGPLCYDTAGCGRLDVLTKSIVFLLLCRIASKYMTV